MELATENAPRDDGDPAATFAQALSDDFNAGQLILPSFPDALIRIRTALSDDNCDISKAARIVSSEPALAARLIRMANSAMLHRGDKKAEDVRTAINRLGFGMARNTATMLAMEQLVHSRELADLREPLEELWLHSVKVAAIAHTLARRFTMINPDAALLAGLLHDVGKLHVLNRAREFGAIQADHDALKKVMGEWHGSLGRKILEGWEFSDEVAEVADQHEKLGREHEGHADLLDIVMIANMLAHQQDGVHEWEQIDIDTVPAAARLGIDSGGKDELMDAADAEIRALTRAMAG